MSIKGGRDGVDGSEDPVEGTQGLETSGEGDPETGVDGGQQLRLTYEDGRRVPGTPDGSSSPRSDTGSKCREG